VIEAQLKMGFMQTRSLTKKQTLLLCFLFSILFVYKELRGLALLHSTSLDVQGGANMVILAYKIWLQLYAKPY
jgi:hypothetical protein